MEKEAKIGFAIILVLLVVFTGVLAKKFYSSKAAEQVLAAGEGDDKNSKNTVGTHEDNSDNPAETKAPIAPAGPPTVVAATSVSGKPPLSTTSDLEQWSSVSDSNTEKSSTGGTTSPTPPMSFMPDPPSDSSSTNTAPNNLPARVGTQVSPDDAEIKAGDSVSSRYSFNNSVAKDSRVNNNTTREERSGSQAPVEQVERFASASYRPERSDPFARYETSDLRESGAPSLGSRELQRTVVMHNQNNSSRTYTVDEGDSLYDIARFELGKASRWVEIYDLNRDLLGNDIERLIPGTQIILPEDNSQNADPLTRRPITGYSK
ncbi:MAG TPA: LysM domain-containing protein [Thermoguttaceae bacterium]